MSFQITGTRCPHCRAVFNYSWGVVGTQMVGEGCPPQCPFCHESMAGRTDLARMVTMEEQGTDANIPDMPVPVIIRDGNTQINLCPQQ